MSFLSYDALKDTLKNQFPVWVDAFDPIKNSIVDLWGNISPEQTEELSGEASDTPKKAQDIAFKLLPFVAAYFSSVQVIAAGLVITVVANLTKVDLVTNQMVKDIFCGVGAALFLTTLAPTAKVVTVLIIGTALIKMGLNYEKTKNVMGFGPKPEVAAKQQD